MSPPRIGKRTRLLKRQVRMEMRRLFRALTRKRRWVMPILLRLAWNTGGIRIRPTIRSSMCRKASMVSCRYVSLKSRKSLLCVKLKITCMKEVGFFGPTLPQCDLRRHTDRNMMYQLRRNKDRFACIGSKRSDESFSIYYLPSRATLAMIICCLPKDTPAQRRRYHHPRHDLLKPGYCICISARRCHCSLNSSAQLGRSAFCVCDNYCSTRRQSLMCRSCLTSAPRLTTTA